MNNEQKRILLSVAIDEAEFAEREWHPDGLPYRSQATVSWKRSIGRACAGLVAVDWRRWKIPNGTEADRARNCRSLKSLVKAGLIERESDSLRGKFNLVRLTPAGRRFVDELCKE